MTETPDSDSTDTEEHTDRDSSRDYTPGRGPGEGQWLEQQLAEALERWGYRAVTRENLLGLETDVLAQRKALQNEPEDYMVGECKDWVTTPVGEDEIIKLCLRAFVARAIPVLCHTSQLTEKAWELAQIFDVRLVNLEDLEKDSLPPLTKYRPPSDTYSHKSETRVEDLRPYLPQILSRRVSQEIEAPVFSRAAKGPCYVVDRTGHDSYVSAYKSDYDFG